MMFKSVTFRYYLLAYTAERLKAFSAYWPTKFTGLQGKQKAVWVNMYSANRNDISGKSRCFTYVC